MQCKLISLIILTMICLPLSVLANDSVSFSVSITIPYIEGVNTPRETLSTKDNSSKSAFQNNSISKQTKDNTHLEKYQEIIEGKNFTLLRITIVEK